MSNLLEIAILSKQDRQDLFRIAAQRLKIHEAVVEKDFWVCFMLYVIFQESTMRDKTIFKGGTSLSKAYNLIKRFSEDIDLILDWRVLGYEKTFPLDDRSKTQQQILCNEIENKTANFLRDVLTPELQLLVSKKNIDMEIIYKEGTDGESGVILAEYPNLYEEEYLQKAIVLEIGALAAWTPWQNVSIKPDLAPVISKYANMDAVEVATTTAERTFWEKITILHREAFRPNDGEHALPKRLSRHYYDIYKMCQSTVSENAIEQINLLAKVANFKSKFYPQNWAHYELAYPGSLKLIPPETNIKELKTDYEKMKVMLYGEIPEFDSILEELKKLEQKINTITT
ncbi:nucleotidyl transferase AbiEii/AbiGii toxin family protein [Candidatus Saccharibacteria bacterium]|nr:nucleotidyl transferase AbiEii/AbiGii toxin family protein [Candidatus Saccharibacteria bacterium]